jgi:hypothetical protein
MCPGRAARQCRVPLLVREDRRGHFCLAFLQSRGHSAWGGRLPVVATVVRRCRGSTLVVALDHPDVEEYSATSTRGNAVTSTRSSLSWWRTRRLRCLRTPTGGTGATRSSASSRKTGKPDLRHRTTRANGQAAVGWYVWSPDRKAYAPASLEVLTIEDVRVKEITAFASPELFERFGLPTELPRATDRETPAVA